jgi:choline dehydrogenase
MSNSSFDTIIVGAGTAGCLLANRLSMDARKRILLIEAGRRDDYHWIHIPVGYLFCIGNPRTDWMYQTQAEPGLMGRVLRYPRGKVLGGSSSINGMIYMRGQARDYDQWAELTGDDRWRWGQCLPYFMLHEDHYLGANAWHGAKSAVDNRLMRLHADTPWQRLWQNHRAGGEWRVEQQRLKWTVLEAFAKAATEAGIPWSYDFNRGCNEGVGYFEVNQRAGWRWNTAQAFLRPTCYGRPNVEIWTNAQVSRLLFEPGTPQALPRCLGVEVWTGQELTTVQASAEVLLSAGSIGSPQILQRSGVGPADLMHQLGIDLVCDSPGVGANLQDHLQLRAVYKVHGAHTLNTRSASLWGKARMALEYALLRSGPLSMAPSQLGLFTRSAAHLAHPNLQYHVQPLSLDAFGEPLHRFDALTASVCNLNPTSRGSVRITSPDFAAPVIIAPNFLSTAQDQQVAVDALRLTRRITAQKALAALHPQELRPGPLRTTFDELAQAAAELGTTIFHPVGTTRMGRADDAMAVLDSELRVRGVTGLRVVDAGAMPTITSGNTNAPTLMLAERAAQLILNGPSP